MGRPTGKAGGSGSAVTGVETVRGLGGADTGGLGGADVWGTGREGGGRFTGVGGSTSDKARTRAGGAGGPSITGGLREGGGGTARAGDPTADKGLAGGGGGGAFLAGGTGG